MSAAVQITPASVTETRELEFRLEQQQLVASFGVFALRASVLEHVFEQVCKVAARGLGTRFVKLLEFRAATQDLLVRNGVGWSDGVVGNATVGADVASPAGFALRTRMPVVSNHLTGETRFRTPELLAAHNIHRAINVIVGDDTDLPFGVLEADSSDRMQFTRHDVAFLQSLANIVAAAIERQRRIDAQAVLIRDKEILMQEAHHRIKNSLQLVQTMLYLQARSVADAGERERLNDAATRIMSIASVHERLYEEGAVERVDLGPYLNGLVTSVCATLRPGTIPVVDAERMQLPAEHITPIGMIAVELVTNALKYGAAPICISVVKTPSGVEMLARDGGPGFDQAFNPGSLNSLGMRLIAAMARTPNPVTIDRSGPGACIRVNVTFAGSSAP